MGFRDLFRKRPVPPPLPSNPPPLPPAPPPLPLPGDEREHYERMLGEMAKKFNFPEVYRQYATGRQALVSDMLGPVIPANYNVVHMELLSDVRRKHPELTQPDQIKAFVKEELAKGSESAYPRKSFRVVVLEENVEDAKKAFGLVFAAPPKLHVDSYDREQGIKDEEGSIRPSQLHTGRQVKTLIYEATEAEMRKWQALKDKCVTEHPRELPLSDEKLGMFEAILPSADLHGFESSINGHNPLQWKHPRLVLRERGESAGREAARESLSDPERSILMAAFETAQEMRVLGKDDDEIGEVLEQAYFDVSRQRGARGLR